MFLVKKTHHSLCTKNSLKKKQSEKNRAEIKKTKKFMKDEEWSWWRSHLTILRNFLSFQIVRFKQKWLRFGRPVEIYTSSWLCLTGLLYNWQPLYALKALNSYTVKSLVFKKILPRNIEGYERDDENPALQP